MYSHFNFEMPARTIDQTWDVWGGGAGAEVLTFSFLFFVFEVHSWMLKFFSFHIHFRILGITLRRLYKSLFHMSCICVNWSICHIYCGSSLTALLLYMPFSQKWIDTFGCTFVHYWYEVLQCEDGTEKWTHSDDRDVREIQKKRGTKWWTEGKANTTLTHP